MRYSLLSGLVLTCSLLVSAPFEAEAQLASGWYVTWQIKDPVDNSGRLQWGVGQGTALVEYIDPTATTYATEALCKQDLRMTPERAFDFQLQAPLVRGAADPPTGNLALICIQVP